MPDGTRDNRTLDGGAQMHSFTPGPSTARAYRDALGAFGTGVTIVTCHDGSGPLAMTANSFSSVSLDPPLVLWSPAISSSRHDAFVAARRFCVHVLGADQLDLARRCAADGRTLDPAEWDTGPDGAPVLRSCPVRFDCRHHASHGAGDHTIVLGLVEEVTAGAGAAPLLFVGGRYGSFARQDD